MVPGALPCPPPRGRAGLPGAKLNQPGDVANFLSHQPPFDGLDRDALAAVAAEAHEVAYAPGESALVEDGPVVDALQVVRRGSMDLLREGRVVDILEPGECFGHPSLLSGLPPAFTVRAREWSACVVIPRAAAERALGSATGVRYVALSLHERLTRLDQTAAALPGLATVRLQALVSRPALQLPPDTPIRDAARAMTEHGVAAALVIVDGTVGIVTDRDLREQVVAAGRSLEDPVRLIAHAPAPRAPARQTAGEAMVDLLDAGARELCVTDDDGTVVGVLSVDELAAGEHTAWGLRVELQRAGDEEALVRTATAGLPHLLVALVASGLEANDISRVLAIQHDTVTARLLDFAFARHGQAPVAWSWLALGSVARRELTLASDQDNALALADGGGKPADEWFARVAADVNAGLARCGFGADHGDVLASNQAWRMEAGEWRATFERCLEYPDRSHLVRAAVGFDFRQVAGGLDVAPPLVAVIRSAPAHPGFLRRLARTVTDWWVPLGRRGRLATDQEGRLDIKGGGARIIANIARLHALSHGITTSSTMDRLLAAERTGALEADVAAGLREAFTVIARVRLRHHAAQLAAGEPPDNRIDPGELAPLARAELREALRAVAAEQRRLRVYRPMGV
jgi:CBS domain-containing protein